MKGSFLLFLMVITTLITSCSALKGYYPESVHRPKKNFSVVWNKNNDPAHETGNLPIALNSPHMYEGILFVGHNQGSMMAYDLENGRQVWNKKDGGSYHGSPVSYKDQVVYGSTQGRVYSRHYLTGELKYSVELGASIESEGVLYKGRIFFHLRNHKIFCLDVETGKILWAYKRSVPFLTTIQRVSKPLIHNNSLYVGFADGFVASFGIEDGVLLWERKLATGSKFIDVDASPIPYNNGILVGSLDGEVYILNSKNGKTLRKLNYSISRSPFQIHGKYFLGTVDGRLIVLDNRLNQLSEKKVGNSPISSIVSWKNNIVVSNVQGDLIYFSLKSDTLKIEEKLHLGHANSAVFGYLKVSEGKLATLSSRNRLYVFK